MPTIPKPLLHEALHAAAIEHLGGKVDYIQLYRSKYGKIVGGMTMAIPERYTYSREAYILQAPSLIGKNGSASDAVDMANLPLQARLDALERLQTDKDTLLTDANRIARHFQATGWYNTPQGKTQ